MKSSALLRFIAPLVIATAALAHEGHEGAAEDDPYAGMPPKRAALERMMSERGDVAAFEKAAKQAKEVGVGDQAILEATFLYHVDRRDDARLAAMLPQFLQRKETFKIEESEIFGVQEDWLAVVEYVQAIAALQKSDRDGFKKHITEAFWLSPRQGTAFAPHIDRLRMEDAMRSVTVDFTAKLASIQGGEPVLLSKLMEKKKGMLFHFWSPWSRECETSMPDFKVTALELEKHGIAVVSLMADSEEQAVADAKKIAGALGAKPPGAWLIDRETDTISRTLRIQSVPAMALISAEGKVLFNGHPSEDALWEALSKLAPEAKRPKLEEK
ncbi:redoxin domain-containing protein [Luteolibacter sp. GHJ8]|uniref:Redoxin domain-containing protein n=1 Tax=Luteolibacter rhizosphaerae TaxID=2989719 RepID=A0ABT3G833_9BACT|nr:redoxin domain-containing protein [Luteolibacter rhizosphaerae]MCW1915960.1 redoxin domain-containing protein [Luteolibacter rhizosphaerae]